MIDEQQQDLAIEYLFGHLEGDAEREFEAWLQSDEEMRILVDELRETTAAIALSAPQELPPPHLRAKILDITRGETITLETPATPSRRRAVGWIPWAIAAGLAIACFVLLADRQKSQSTANSTQDELARALVAADTARAETDKLSGRLQLSQAQTATYMDQIAELRDEVVKLRGRDALAQVKIATLTAQVAEYAKAAVIIVWNEEEQRGVVKLANLPKPEEGKDYQLWVIDPKYPAPVNGGVLPIADVEQTRVAFKPDQLVEHADKFAISIEKTGGVPKAEGPVIFVGQ